MTDDRRQRFAGAWALLFGASLALFTLTLQRHTGWQDSGWFQLRAVVQPYVSTEFTEGLGLALAHPSYVALIRLFARLCAWNPVWGVNWVSALGMAVAVANAGCLVFRLTGRRAVWPALLAGVLLSVSHVVWWLSTIAEVYTCVAALLTTELLCLLSLAERPAGWRVGVLALLAGVHWSFHNYALLALPVYGAVVAELVWRRRIGLGWLAAAPLLFAAGAWPYLRLIAEMAQTSGWGEAIFSALFGTYHKEVLSVSPRWLSMIRINAALFSLNFMNPAWLLFFAGLWRCLVAERSRARGCVLAVMTLHGLFFARYFVADQALFALPTVTLMAVVAGVGADAVRTRLGAGVGRQALLLALTAWVPVCAYLGVDRVLHQPRFAVANRRALPFRDEVRYWMLPWKHDEDSAWRFLKAALSETEPDAVVVADNTSVIVLQLEGLLNPQAVGQRTFLENRDRISVKAGAPLLTDYYRANRGRAWYTVSPLPGYLAPFFLDGPFAFEKRGALYRIVPKREPVAQGQGAL